LILALLAIHAHVGGLDRAIADAVFDTATRHFPWRDSAAMELFGHRLLRGFVTAVWAVLALTALGSTWIGPLRRWRRLLVATALAMALGPTIVVVLKSFTTFPCPWSLVRYGGSAAEATHWFTTPSGAGQCFPAGHAAGGFSLVALAFGLAGAGRYRSARIMLAIALAFGIVSATVRTLQGAHFLSHSLWSAAIDWWIAAVVVARAGRVGGQGSGRGPPIPHDLSARRSRLGRWSCLMPAARIGRHRSGAPPR
jgi:membrane-associated PAP2 superfamily phosphatase